MYRRKQRLTSIFLLILTIFNTIFIDTSIYAARKPVYDQQLVDEGSMSNDKIKVLMYQVGDLNNADNQDLLFVDSPYYLGSNNSTNKKNNTFRFYFPQYWYVDTDQKIKYVYQHKLSNNEIINFIANEDGDTSFNVASADSQRRDHFEYTEMLRKNRDNLIELYPIYILDNMYFDVDFGRLQLYGLEAKLYTEKGELAFTGRLLDKDDKELSDYDLSITNMNGKHIGLDLHAGKKVRFKPNRIIKPGDLLHADFSKTMLLDYSAGFENGVRKKSSYPFTDSATFNEIKNKYEKMSYINGLGSISIDSFIRINDRPIDKILGNRIDKSDINIVFKQGNESAYVSMNGGNIQNFYTIAGGGYDLIKNRGELKYRLSPKTGIGIVQTLSGIRFQGNDNIFYIRDMKNNINPKDVKFYFVPYEAMMGHSNKAYKGLYDSGQISELDIEEPSFIDFNSSIELSGFPNLKFRDGRVEPKTLKVSLKSTDNNKSKINKNGFGVIYINSPKRDMYTLRGSELVPNIYIDKEFPGDYILTASARKNPVTRKNVTLFYSISNKETEGFEEGTSIKKDKIIIKQDWLGTKLNSSLFKYSYLENSKKKSGIIELSASNGFIKEIFIPQSSIPSLEVEYLDKNKVPLGVNITTSIDWDNPYDMSWNRPNKGRMYNERGELLYTIDKNIYGNTITFTNTRNMLFNVFTNTNEYETKNILSRLGFRQTVLDNINFKELNGGYGLNNKASFNIFEKELVHRYSTDNKVKDFVNIGNSVGNIGGMFDKNEFKKILSLRDAELEGLKNVDFSKLEAYEVKDALDFNRINDIYILEKMLSSKDLNSLKPDKASDYELYEFRRYFDDDYRSQQDLLKHAINNEKVVTDKDSLSEYISKNNLFMLEDLGDYEFNVVKDGLNGDKNSLYEISNLKYIKDMNSLYEYLKYFYKKPNSSFDDVVKEAINIKNLDIDIYYFSNAELIKYMDLEKFAKNLDLNKLSDDELKNLRIDFNKRDIYSNELFLETVDFSKLKDQEIKNALDFNKVNNIYTLEKLLSSKDIDSLKPVERPDYEWFKFRSYFDDDYQVQQDILKYAINNEKAVTDKYSLINYVNKNNLYMLGYLSNYEFKMVKDGLNGARAYFYTTSNLRYIKDMSSLHEYLKFFYRKPNSSFDEVVREAIEKQGLDIDVNYLSKAELVRYMDLEKLAKNMDENRRKEVFNLANADKNRLTLSETNYNYRRYISEKTGYLNPYTRQANIGLLNPRIDIINPIEEIKDDEKVVIKKVSDSKDPLANVKFILKKKKEDGNKEQIGQYATNRNGEIELKNLGEGTYYLEEIDPLTGYQPLDKDVKFILTRRLISNGKGGLTLKTFINNSPDTSIEIVNNKIEFEELKVSKVDSYDTNQKIADAQFELIMPIDANIDDNDKVLLPNGYLIDKEKLSELKEVNVELEGEDIKWIKDGKSWKIKLHSRADGRLYYQSQNMPIKLVKGNYILKEIKAPDGYILDTKTHNLKIDSNQEETLIKNERSKKELLVRKTDRIGRNLGKAIFMLEMYKVDNKVGDKYLLPNGEKVSSEEYLSENEIVDHLDGEEVVWKLDDKDEKYYLELESRDDGRLYYKSMTTPFSTVQGVYRLRETKAPSSYIKTDKEYILDVGKSDKELVIANKIDNSFAVTKSAENIPPFNGIVGAEFEAKKGNKTYKLTSAGQEGVLYNYELDEVEEFEDGYHIELTETKAPSGYSLDNRTYRIGKSEVDGLKVEIDDELVTITASDIEKYQDRLVLEGTEGTENEYKPWIKLQDIKLDETNGRAEIELRNHKEYDTMKHIRVYDKNTDNYFIFGRYTVNTDEPFGYPQLVLYVITNKKLPSFIKVDEKGNPLENAKFKLELTKEENKKDNQYLLPGGLWVDKEEYDLIERVDIDDSASYYMDSDNYWIGSDGSEFSPEEYERGEKAIRWEKNSSKDAFETEVYSDKDGSLLYESTDKVFQFMEGKYRLTETNPPVGYLKKSEPLKIGLQEVNNISLDLKDNNLVVNNQGSQNLVLEAFNDDFFFKGWKEIKPLNAKEITEVNLADYYKKGRVEKFRVWDKNTRNTFLFEYDSDTIRYAISNQKSLKISKVNDKGETLRNAQFLITMPKDKNKVKGGYLLPDGSVVSEREYGLIGESKSFDIQGQEMVWYKEGNSLKTKLTSKDDGRLYYKLNREPFEFLDGYYEISEEKAPAGYLRKQNQHFVFEKNILNNLELKLRDNILIINSRTDGYSDRLVLEGWIYNREKKDYEWRELETFTETSLKEHINLSYYYDGNSIEKFRLWDKETENYYLFHYDDDEIVYSVTNKKMIDFLKTDEEGRKLKNAEFELIMSKEDNKLEDGKILMPDGSKLSEKEYDNLSGDIKLMIDGNSTTWEKDENNLKVRLKTKDDGKLYYVGPKGILGGIIEDIFGADPFKFNEGNYTLKEIGSPEGYLIKEEEFQLGRNQVDNLRLDLTDNILSLEAMNKDYESGGDFDETRLIFQGKKVGSYSWENLENISLVKGKLKTIALDKKYSSYRILDRKTGNSYIFSYDGDEITYIVTNERAMAFKKVDEKGTGLVGAEFELLSKEEKSKSLTSSSGGRLIYSGDKKTFSLLDKPYTLKETKAPEGYLIKKKSFEVKKNEIDGLRLNLNKDILTLKAKGSNYENRLIFEAFEVSTGKWHEIEGLSWIELEQDNDFAIGARINLADYKGYSQFRLRDKSTDNYFDFIIGSDLITYSITNERAMEIKKVDEKDRPLSGASFDLISKDGEKIKSLESDKAGNLLDKQTNRTFSLLDEEYSLEETKAPLGYIRKKDSFDLSRNEIDNLVFRIKENILTIEAKDKEYKKDRLYLERRVYDQWNQEGSWERIEALSLEGPGDLLNLNLKDYNSKEDVKFFRIVDEKTGNSFLLPYDSDRIVYSISNKKMISLVKSDEEYRPLKDAEFELLMYKEDNTLEDGRIQLPDGSRVSPSQYENKKLVKFEIEGENVTWEKDNKEGPFRVRLKSKEQGDFIYILRKEGLFGFVSYEDGKHPVKLVEGNYRLRENKAPEGYLIKEEEISFSSNQIDNLDFDLTDNKLTIGLGKAIGTRDLVLEGKTKDDKWQILEEISIGEDKLYVKELPSEYGEFRLRDIKTEAAYAFAYDSDDIFYFITNERSIKVRKADELGRELSGAKFKLSSEDNKENKELISDKGKDLLSLDGKYLLEEREAPEGYSIKKEIFSLDKNEVDNLRLNLNKNILTLLAKDDQYKDRLVLRGKDQEGELQILEEISLDKKGDIYKKKLPTGYEDLELVDRQTGNKFVFSYDDNKVRYLITNERAPKVIKTDESGQVVSNAEFALYMDKDDNRLEDGKILLPDGRLVTDEEYKKINLLEMNLDGENVTWEKDKEDGPFKLGLKSNTQGELVYRLRKLDWLKRPYYEDGNKPIKFLKGKYKLVETKAPEGFLLKEGSIDINKKQIDGLDIGLFNEILSLRLEKGDYKADLVLKGLSEGEWIDIEHISLAKESNSYEKKLSSKYKAYRLLDKDTGNFYSFSLDDDLITYSFVNEKESSLMKVDSFGNPLGGAEFELSMPKEENTNGNEITLPDGQPIGNEEYENKDKVDITIDKEVITWTKVKKAESRVKKAESRDEFVVRIESRDNGKFYYLGTNTEVILEKIPAFNEGGTFILKEIRAPLGYMADKEEITIKNNNFDGLGIRLEKNKLKLDIDSEEKYESRLRLEGINRGDSKWTQIEMVNFPKNIFNAWKTFEKTIDSRFDEYRVLDIETGNFFRFSYDDDFISYAIRNKRLVEVVKLNEQLKFLPGTEFELLMYKDDNKLLDRYALTSKIVLPDGNLIDEKDYKDQKDIEIKTSGEVIKWKKEEIKQRYSLKLVVGEDGKLYYTEPNESGKGYKVAKTPFKYYSGNYVLKETKAPFGYTKEENPFKIGRNSIDGLSLDITSGKLTLKVREDLKEEYKDRMVLKGYKYNKKDNKYIWEEVSRPKFTDNKFKLDLSEEYESFRLVDSKTTNFFSFEANSDLISFNIVNKKNILPEAGFTNILGIGLIGLITLLSLAILYNLNSIRKRKIK